MADLDGWQAGHGRRWQEARRADRGGAVLKVGTSGFLELGIRPPYAHTVGSGSAVVLRDGRAYHVHWSRPVADGGTVFTLPDGSRMPFASGQVWVIYGFGPRRVERQQ